MRKIPTFIIEEHHEAFIVWNLAVEKGWLPSTKNYLFHVDEHSDMATPRFNRSVLELKDHKSDVKKFTYEELNIASFIIPACYCELFNKVYWFRQKHKRTYIRPVKMFVRSYNQAGKRLVSGRIKDLKTIVDDTDRKSFDYYLQTIEQMPPDKKVVLDIDLDYFSCSGNPNALEEIYIEITKEEYENFIHTPYHKLRYCGFSRVEAEIKDNRYYYIANNFNELYPVEVKVEQPVITERIDRFVELLERKKVIPYIIDICRSRFSGYTPLDQWKFIEETLMERLKKLYDMKYYSI